MDTPKEVTFRGAQWASACGCLAGIIADSREASPACTLCGANWIRLDAGRNSQEADKDGPVEDEDVLLDNIEDILFEYFRDADGDNPIGRAGYRVWKLARDFYSVSGALAVREAASPDLEAFQNDVRDLLHALDLPDHARPSSPHEVVRREVLPAIGNLQAKFLRALDISQNWLFMYSCCPAYCGSRTVDDGGVRDSGQPCTCGRKDLLIELSLLRGRRSHHASLFELVEATVACPVCGAPAGAVCVKNPGRKPRIPHQDRIKVYERVSRGQRTSES